MASPSVTYSFSPSSTIASSQVNQNFTDLINALTDATKSLSIDGLTVAGAALFKGNVTLGDATSDTVTYVSRVSSSIDPSVTNTYDCGDASYVWANVYATNLYGTLATAAQANVTSLGTLTSLTVTGNVTVDTNTLFVDATNNGIGLGTTSIQGKLHLHAPASSTMLAGPNIVATVDTDTYPVFATLFSGHDNIEMFFDAYYASGQYKSSDAGSNFRIRKNSDLLAIEATGLVAAGSQIVSWQPAIYVDYAGQVGINTSTMLGDFNVKGTSVIHDTTATTGQNLVFVTQNSSQNYFMGINDAGYLCIGTAGTGAVVGSLVNYIRVDSGGRLAIGTSDTTSAKMTVQCASGASAGFLVKNEDGESIIQIGQDATKGSQIICRADGGSDITLWVKPDSFVWNERGADADFRIESDTVEYAFFVDGETGNVGIGTTPSNRLHVYADNTSYAQHIRQDNIGGSGLYILTDGSGTTEFPLAIDTGGGTIGAFYVRNDGNVGIGTSSPSYHFHIVKDAAGQQAAVIKNASTNASAASAWVASNGTNEIRLLRAGTSYSSYGAFTSNDGAVYSDHSIVLMADNASGIIKFATGGSSEKMRIDNSGNVGIGTTPSYNLDIKSTASAIIRLNCATNSDPYILWAENDASKWALQNNNVNDQFEVYDYSDSSVATYVAAGGTDWTATSDGRLKTDITTIEDCLTTVCQIPVRRFKWIKDGKEDFGFVAQELKPLCPEAVAGEEVELIFDENGNARNSMGVTKTALIPYLTKAIQELNQKYETEIAAKQEQISSLETQLSTILARLEALENK